MLLSEVISRGLTIAFIMGHITLLNRLSLLMKAHLTDGLPFEARHGHFLGREQFENVSLSGEEGVFHNYFSWSHS
jgi:hypothetical protein